MRYTSYLLALIILLGAVAATPAFADEDKCDDEDYPVMDCPRDGEPMGRGPGMGEGRGMGEGPMGMHRDGPWEGGWYERPWNFWRHLDEGALDWDAMHYMSGIRTVAIMPFMDATNPSNQGTSKLDAAGGPRRIVENLAADLMSRGYLVIPPMDVQAVYRNILDTGMPYMSSEISNNSFWFGVMPERAMDFYMEVVPGLGDQYDQSTGRVYYVSKEDIQAMAEALGADCVIRGFIYEYSVSSDIDADWRTFVPPFLGLLNPDRRAVIEVAYYLYDGHSGELIWNGAVEVRDDANWPLFESESELLWDVEHEAVWQMTGRILPNWADLVWAHPNWVPFEMWDEFDEDDWNGYMHRPGWVNPLRDGWHESYERHDIRWDDEFVENPGIRYRDLTHSYNRAQ